ncbi:MAG: hypothetical protein LBQ50_01525 [Planctomycetaceae bacterium]|nr:hypothetical protein [Planctomycetaceae bacterium]
MTAFFKNFPSCSQVVVDLGKIRYCFPVLSSLIDTQKETVAFWLRGFDLTSWAFILTGIGDKLPILHTTPVNGRKNLIFFVRFPFG